MKRWAVETRRDEPASEPMGFDVGTLSAPWRELLYRVAPSGLRPVQAQFLARGCLLHSRRNLVVVAPTNAGKSLVGDLVALEAVARGRRAVLVEPLRALAQQRASDLRELAAQAAGLVCPRAPKVRLTTGDYRLEHEDMASTPPPEGEVVVATPERLEAIGRHEAGPGWFQQIGAVVVDEAHLVGEPRRGPTLEFLVARMKVLPAPPRVVLLSATVGEPERLAAWLEPADLIVETRRVPRLELSVVETDADEDVDAVVLEELDSALAAADTAALVFVYRRSDAESLANKLAKSERAWAPSVASFHSGLPTAAREAVRRRFLDGDLRVVVATTSLALGLNLPATHVVVRDSVFPGHGRLGVDQLMQMAGRAGRGLRTGSAVVMVRGGRGWSEGELVGALSRGELPPIRSAFAIAQNRRGRAEPNESRAPGCVAALLATAGEAGMSGPEIEGFSAAMLAGPAFVTEVPGALRWLGSEDVALAYRTEDARWHLTRLGERAVSASLPLPYAAAFARLVRDLLSLESDRPGTLARWSELDHLLVVELLRDDARSLRRFGEALAEQVDGWMETRPGAFPVLFDWIRGDAEHSRAAELAGSLGQRAESPSQARSRAYVAMAHAIVLLERGRGTTAAELERRWKVPGLEGAEERWRDTSMWLLAGHARLLDLPVFYHHLLESCGADVERIRNTKRALANMRRSALDLIEVIKFCSPLGPLARGVRHMMREDKRPSVGPGTIRALEAAGYRTMVEVAQAPLEKLVLAGVRRDLAKQIARYCRARMR